MPVANDVDLGAIAAKAFADPDRFIGRDLPLAADVQSLVFDAFTGDLISNTQDTQRVAPSLQLYSGTASFVRDTAAFGAVSPVLGQRIRVDASRIGGDLSFLELSEDVRQYVMPFRPLTLAGRAMHFGRFGSDVDDERLFPLYLGYPTLVRGYGSGSFQADECPPSHDGRCATFDRLFGNQQNASPFLHRLLHRRHIAANPSLDSRLVENTSRQRSVSARRSQDRNAQTRCFRRETAHFPPLLASCSPCPSKVGIPLSTPRNPFKASPI